jgi:hypothetical protein
MQPLPQTGEAWFVDLGMVEKPRWVLVVGCHKEGRLAVASVVLITTQYANTCYEIKLPRVPWLREQSYINAQSIQPVRFTEFVHIAPGQFDASVTASVKQALARWLALGN